jgi:hypothetical protein
MGLVLKESPCIIGGYFKMIKSLMEERAGIRHLKEDNIRFKDTITKLRLVYITTNNDYHMEQ